MTRLFPILAFLTACTAPIEIPPPPETGGRSVTYERGYPGAIASAYPLAGRIVVDSEEWNDLPGPVRVYALAHELCHVQGIVDEAAADCCALRWMHAAGYLPPSWEATIVAWLANRGATERAVQLLECSR